MNINKITEVQIKIIINTSLYKKKIIDEQTFSLVNEMLLKKLRCLQEA